MKLIKFDTLYPAQYLTEKIKQNKNIIKKMSFPEFNDWLIGLRLNFSDYYSYNLRQAGWDAQDFFVLGSGMYLRKLGMHYFGSKFLFIYVYFKLFGKYTKRTLLETLIDKVIAIEKPNVLFIREQSRINSLFWDKYRDDKLVVSRMECGIPKYWSPACFDVIYTNINTYRDFFKSNRYKTHTNYSGFDSRIINEISSIKSTFQDEIAFVGGLGADIFREKTEFLESFLRQSAGQYSFAWWGYKENDSFDIDFPLLAKHYMGVSGGLEMFSIYKNAKIILNDYGIAAGGQGMNQRIYEVLGVGGFLLTRSSSMFETWGDCIATYDNVEDCIRKIGYYLNHDDERASISQKGQEYVLEHFNYKCIMEKLGSELLDDYNKKFGMQA